MWLLKLQLTFYYGCQWLFQVCYHTLATVWIVSVHLGGSVEEKLQVTFNLLDIVTVSEHMLQEVAFIL